MLAQTPAEGDRWPDAYKAVVQKRIDVIETSRAIGMIERPEYKRRWNIEPWEEQVQRTLRDWLLDLLLELAATLGTVILKSIF